MLPGLSESDKTGLIQWIESSLASNSNSLASGYQGQALIYRDDEKSLVIKVPHGRGLIRWFHIRMLHHEYAVYRKLANFESVPGCYGMLDDQYLVLQYINGAPIRLARPQDEERYFQQLFSAIGRMHKLGVAHMDLKKKDNLLVVDGIRPCLIDFGAAVIYQAGFHPFNHWRYKLGVRFDYNAWVKHKYHDRLDELAGDDRFYYNQTITERVARSVKKFYTNTLLQLLRHIIK